MGDDGEGILHFDASVRAVRFGTLWFSVTLYISHGG